jgi:anti-sigma-D factor RsdA-like protein
VGGHRAFGAGDDLVDGPVDLAAVRADDALLDAIAGGAGLGALGSHEDVFGRPGQDDDELAAILAAWKADIEADPMPELVSLDEASEAVEAGHEARDRRTGRAKRRMPFAVAAAAIAIALAGFTVAVHSAQPGDTMFGLTKVLFSQQAESAQKAKTAHDTIVAANTAIRQGKPADAQSLLQSAAGQIQAVQPVDQPPLQQQREEALKSLAAQPPAESASPTTAPSASSGTPEGTTAKDTEKRKRSRTTPTQVTPAPEAQSPVVPSPETPAPTVPGGRAATSTPPVPPPSPTS